jgi:hypothetical protein
MMLSVGFFNWCSIKMRWFPSILNLLKVFIIHEQYTLSDVFLYQVICLSFFSFLVWWITFFFAPPMLIKPCNLD